MRSIARLNKRLAKLEKAAPQYDWVEVVNGFIESAIAMLSIEDQKLMRTKRWKETHSQNPALWNRFDAALEAAIRKSGTAFSLYAIDLMLL